MNIVVLVGRLTNDVELNYTPNTQNAKATFTLAVDRPRREGQNTGADFIRITVWGRQAETCKRYIGKGRQCAVQGRIQTGSYKNRDGQTVYTTDVVADRVEFLGGGQQAPQQERPQERPQQERPQQYRWEDEPPYAPAFSAMDDDVPY